MSNLAVERLYDKLKHEIMSDNMQIGDKMPTEQTLCTTYGIGRSTVREALRTLQAKGFLETRRGSGAYIVSKTETVNWILNHKDNILDCMEMRIVIESFAVKRFIATNKGNCTVLEQIQEEFEKAAAENDWEKMSALDLKFHEAIASNSDNSVLDAFNRLIQKEFNTYRNITFQNKATTIDAISAHRQIIDAIKRQATDDAVFAIMQHLRISTANALKGV